MTAIEHPGHVAALRDLHRVLLLVNSGRSLLDVLHAAARGVHEVLGFAGVAINLLTARGDLEAVVVLGPGTASVTGSRYERAEFQAELDVADRWGMLYFVPAGRYPAPDGVVSWSSQEPPLDLPDAWLADDALYAPLLGPDAELLGIMSLDQPVDGRRPGPDARAIVEMYAAQIGLAVSHARERDRLRERYRLSSATRLIVSTAAEARELDDVLAACVEPLVHGFRATRAWIRLHAHPGGAWESVNFPPDLEQSLHLPHGGDWPVADPRLVFASAARVAGQCWAHRQTLVLERGHEQDHADPGPVVVPRSSRARVLDWLDAFGDEQFVMVPLGSAGQCLGYVVMTRPAASGPWTAAEEDAAMDVARELGRVVNVARVRAREQELVRRLEELDAHRTQMITTVVHELKNPLAAVLGNLELVRDDPEVADRAHQAIEASAGRMLGLVQDMLTLSRLREPVSARHTEVDLAALVRDVADQLRTQAGQAGVAVDLTDVDALTVHGDATEIEQLTLNLVSNAIKFSDAGDVVRVRLHPDGPGTAAAPGWVVLEVVDEGLGIAVADQSVLFGEFQRTSNPEARRRPGSGLGLAIAARVAERHGGRIEVDSEPGRGSTFRVRLRGAPACRED